MAASVRVEDEAFSDARIKTLAKLAGWNEYEALGRMAHIWRRCTQLGRGVLSETQIDTLLGDGGTEMLLRAELGTRLSRGRGSGVRIKGTKGRVEWLKKARLSAANAGVKRAIRASRRNDGTFSPADYPAAAGSVTPALSSAPASASAPTLGSRIDHFVASDPFVEDPRESARAESQGVDTETNARPTRLLEGPALAELGRQLDKHGRSKPPRWDRQNHRDIAKLVGKWPQASDWERILGHYAADERYAFAAWSTAWLARNLDEVATRAASPALQQSRAPGIKPDEPRRHVPGVADTLAMLSKAMS